MERKKRLVNNLSTNYFNNSLFFSVVITLLLQSCQPDGGNICPTPGGKREGITFVGPRIINNEDLIAINSDSTYKLKSSIHINDPKLLELANAGFRNKDIAEVFFYFELYQLTFDIQKFIELYKLTTKITGNGVVLYEIINKEKSNIEKVESDIKFLEKVVLDNNLLDMDFWYDYFLIIEKLKTDEVKRNKVLQIQKLHPTLHIHEICEIYEFSQQQEYIKEGITYEDNIEIFLRFKKYFCNDRIGVQSGFAVENILKYSKTRFLHFQKECKNLSFSQIIDIFDYADKHGQEESIVLKRLNIDFLLLDNKDIDFFIEVFRKNKNLDIIELKLKIEKYKSVKNMLTGCTTYSLEYDLIPLVDKGIPDNREFSSLIKKYGQTEDFVRDLSYSCVLKSQMNLEQKLLLYREYKKLFGPWSEYSGFNELVSSGISLRQFKKIIGKFITMDIYDHQNNHFNELVAFSIAYYTPISDKELEQKVGYFWKLEKGNNNNSLTNAFLAKYKLDSSLIPLMYSTLESQGVEQPENNLHLLTGFFETRYDLINKSKIEDELKTYYSYREKFFNGLLFGAKTLGEINQNRKYQEYDIFYELAKYQHIFELYDYIGEEEKKYGKPVSFMLGGENCQVSVLETNPLSHKSLGLFYLLLKQADQLYKNKLVDDWSKVIGGLQEKTQLFLKEGEMNEQEKDNTLIYVLYPDSKNPYEDHNNAFEGDKKGLLEYLQKLGYKHVTDYSSDTNNRLLFSSFIDNIKSVFNKEVVDAIKLGKTPKHIRIYIGAHGGVEQTTYALDLGGDIDNKEFEELFQLGKKEGFSHYISLYIESCNSGYKGDKNEKNNGNIGCFLSTKLHAGTSGILNYKKLMEFGDKQTNEYRGILKLLLQAELEIPTIKIPKKNGSGVIDFSSVDEPLSSDV